MAVSLSALGTRHLSLKRLTSDFGLNLIATFISTGTMQLLLYPSLAAQLGSIRYGSMLTIIGIINVITASFGSNLLYARLVRERVYKANKTIGDFQILLACMASLSGALAVIVCFVFDVGVADGVGIVVLTITTVIQSYYLVEYRLRVDYKKNLFANIFLCIGYIFGSLVLLRILPWAWAFVAANVLCIGYIAASSHVMREPYIKTDLMKGSVSVFANLVAGGLLGNMTNYLDRFIIFPLLGPASVAIYAVAVYFSKGLSLAFTPLVGVLLTYFTQGQIRITKKLYVLLNSVLVAGSFIYVFVCVTLGALITNFLYPSLYEESSSYIFLASIGVVIGLIASFNGTIVMTYASSKWQTIIPALSFIAYCVAVIPLAIQYGLYGVCVASIISSSLRFLFNVVVGWAAICKLRL